MLELNEKPTDEKPKFIYIFKANSLLSCVDKERIRLELKRQISQGVVLLDGRIIYIGKEMAIDHCDVEIVDIEKWESVAGCSPELQEQHFVVALDAMHQTMGVTCIHNNGDYCKVLSDAEVKQPCVEGPCPYYAAPVVHGEE